MNNPDIWPPEPPGKKKKSGSAGKSLQVVLALVIVGAVGYFLYTDMMDGRTGDEAGTAAKTDRPGTLETPARSSTRSDKILTCTAADGSTFYTNAATCKDADLENRVNVVPSDQAGSTMGQNCLSTQPEQGVNMFLSSCQEEFSRALEIERFLASAQDPATSRRAGEYCDLIAQGVSNGCMATSQTFCYLQICQQRLEEQR